MLRWCFQLFCLIFLWLILLTLHSELINIICYNQLHKMKLNKLTFTLVVLLFLGGTLYSQSKDKVTAYRFRADFKADLDEDTGWAADINIAPTLTVDTPFRVRFETETDGSEFMRQYSLQYRINGGDWMYMEAEEFPYESTNSPIASIVSCENMFIGEEAEDLLPVSKLPSAIGAGISLSPVTPRWTPKTKGGESAEWEWAVVIRHWSDGPYQVKDGDRFSLRMVDRLEQPLIGLLPEFTVEVPEYHLGGTFVETPARIGPWETANGNLYYIMEPTETDNVFMMMKSTDEGKTWAEIDSKNRPSIADLEGVASVMTADGIIHIAHQTSDEVIHHAFATTDNKLNADKWIINSDIISLPIEPPTQVVDVAARPDGSLVAIFGADDKLHLSVRYVEGKWGKEFPLDIDKPYWQTSPAVIARPNGIVDIAYKTLYGNGWYRQLLTDGTLTKPVQIAEELGTTEDESISILPLIFIPETNTLVVVYRNMNGYLYMTSKTNNNDWSEPLKVSDREVVTNPVDSDQVAADVVAYNGRVYVSFIAEENRNIYLSTIDMNDKSNNIPQIRRIVGEIDGSWVRGQVLHNQQNSPVYGLTYDAGSKGGSGFNKYLAIPLQ